MHAPKLPAMGQSEAGAWWGNCAMTARAENSCCTALSDGHTLNTWASNAHGGNDAERKDINMHINISTPHVHAQTRPVMAYDPRSLVAPCGVVLFCGEGGNTSKLKVLIACEFSGVVRNAFIRNGHNAMSCDLLPSDTPGPHYQGDVRDIIGRGWDLMIAHPPCTHLAVSGARWFKDKQTEQAEAMAFVRLLMDVPIPHIAIENPVSIISSRIRKPDQIIQPWQFGHGETKTTCLWLKGLPKLTPTDIVSGRVARIHRMPPGPNRWKERSRTFPGIARAMADQWGGVIAP